MRKIIENTGQSTISGQRDSSTFIARAETLDRKSTT